MEKSFHKIVVFTLFLSTSPLWSAPLLYQTTVLQDDPVAFWRLGESSGTTLVDSSNRTNKHHGAYGTSTRTPALGVAGVTGTGDTAASFDPNKGAFAEITDSADFNLRDYTLSAWINIAPGAASSNRRIVSQQNGNNYWLLHINNHQLTSWSSLDSVFGIQKGPALNDGQWHHVAISRDTANDVMTWWIDGQAVGTEVITSNATYNISANVHIGRHGPPNSDSQFFDGAIDEIAVFDTALGADRLELQFDAGIGNLSNAVVPEPNTVVMMVLAVVSMVFLRQSHS